MQSLLRVAVLVIGLPAWATTLQQLSLNDLILKSTAIVRGRPTLGTAALKGSIVYTHYQIQVTDQLKGTSPAAVDLAVPGGSVRGITQTYSGAPLLLNGQDYVFFLWTSPSGLTQIIGLTQGLFQVVTGTDGAISVSRPGSTTPMLDPAGNAVADTSFTMLLSDLKQRIANTLAGKGAN